MNVYFKATLQKIMQKPNPNVENEVLKDPSGRKLRKTPKGKPLQYPDYTYTTLYPYARLGW